MRKGQKMPEELRRKMIEDRKANPVSYWKGKKRAPFSLEWRKKLSESQKLAYKEGRRKVSVIALEKISNLNKGKTGKIHPKWTENKKRPLHQAIRTLHEYKEWRLNIFEKDNYTCTLCSKRGGDIEAHHDTKRFIDILKDNKVDTVEKALGCKELWYCRGRTLCKKCHIEETRLNRR